MMDELVNKEEQRLCVSCSEFMKRHEEIMTKCDRQLLQDLMEEQREEM